MKNLIFSKLKANWKSGLTVSLVSIPLSVSLAVASHASPVMGIVTAVWAGLVASFFGGSNFNIVGPTGALSGILATYAIAHGQESLAVLAIVSGVFILLAYFFHLERYLVFVPGSAIHGFTLGVAFIIGLNQLNFAFGLTGLKPQEKFIENVIQSLVHVDSASLLAVVIFLLSLLVLFLFKKFVPRLPGAIVLAPVGILFGYLTANNFLPLAVQTLDSIYPNIHLALFLPYKLSVDSSILVPAFAVALVAILETMISAKIADGMTKTKYNQRKEMSGLGLANIASGLMGGMPATAALARTSLNVKTQANDKMSATISSLAVAIISLFLLGYFKYIPLPVIAAILVFVAIQMVEFEHFKRMFKFDRTNFYVSMVVAFVTIYEDPIVGIMFGVAISSIMLLEKISRGQFDLVINDKHKMIGHVSGEYLQKTVKGSNTVVYSTRGMLCYINCEAHLNRIQDRLKGAKNIILRLRSVYYIDMDGVETIDEIIRTVQAQGMKIFITGVSPIVAEMLNESAAYRELIEKGMVYEHSTQALTSLGFKLN